MEWDASGNLTRTGDLRFCYDWRDRVRFVEDGSGSQVAEYRHDAFNRRVGEVIRGQVETTVWDGWRPVERYLNGQLTERRTYGQGLEDVVLLLDPVGQEPGRDLYYATSTSDGLPFPQVSVTGAERLGVVPPFCVSRCH